MKYTCVVVAAGKSERFDSQQNKLLTLLSNGLSVLDNALSNFILDDDCQQLIVVCNQETYDYVQDDGKIIKVMGGESRSQSVYNGLQKATSEIVMVHDGARCYLLKEDLQTLKQAMASERAALLVRNEIDTIKQVEDGYIVKSVDRNILKRATTPQCFYTDDLLKAYQKAFENNDSATDDCGIIEKYSDIKIKCVNCIGENTKVTTIDDIK